MSAAAGQVEYLRIHGEDLKRLVHRNHTDLILLYFVQALSILRHPGVYRKTRAKPNPACDTSSAAGVHLPATRMCFISPTRCSLCYYCWQWVPGILFRRLPCFVVVKSGWANAVMARYRDLFERFIFGRCRVQGVVLPQ